MRNTITRTVAAALGLGLTISLAGPVAAQERDAVRPSPETTTTAARQVDAPPTPQRPAERDAERDAGRPKKEVLHMACEAADGDEGTRTNVGCRWRAASSDQAAGYQLWRIVDRGERTLVARGGLDMLGARDVVPADAQVVRYAVLALNEDGRIVGQSRVQKIELGDDDGGNDRVANARSRDWAKSVR